MMRIERRAHGTTVSAPFRQAKAIVPVLACCFVILTQPPSAKAAVSLVNPRVENLEHPLGIDEAVPAFSWQMKTEDERGTTQRAYRIIVSDPDGISIWDSAKVVSAHSINISYAGAPLKATTRYEWTVTVWDSQGRVSEAHDWFETGLMNSDPQLSGWSGAKWIGGGDSDTVLYASYLPLFDLSYNLTIAPGSERASIVFAANDPRLMDRNKNIYQLANKRNESYFKVEFDVGALRSDPSGAARINVYRAGYLQTDDPRKPLKSYRIRRSLIDLAGKYAPHRISIRAEFGELNLRIDGVDQFFEAELPGNDVGPTASRVSHTAVLNPAGLGGVLTYGYLCELGFALDAGQSASFSELVVSNIREPANALLREDLTQQPYEGMYARFAEDASSGLRVLKGAYVVKGGSNGMFLVADPTRNAMPMLRTNFAVQKKKVRTARLYATARGVYELHLNGQRLGDEYFNPGLTQYNVTHLYQTYDVSDLVRSGENALGAMLGEGWWSGMLGYGRTWNHFGDRPSLLAKLVITYEDGSSDVVTSNTAAWKYFNAGPIVYSSLYMGEVYDATRESAIDGWSTAAYDDRSWRSAERVDLASTAYGGDWRNSKGDPADLDFKRLALVGQIGESAKIYQVLTARSVKEVRKGVFVYNMGQNLVGVPRISFKDGIAGQHVKLRVAEMLYPDLPASGGNVGMIMTENYRAALSQDEYIMKAGPQVFQPKFTFHGYQYLEITGIDAPLPLTDVQAFVISSVRMPTASYESSNPKVNKLWSNLVWSNIDNFLSIPTDCPQRNERLGWSGDLSVFARTATYVSDASSFLRRHLRSMRDVQDTSGRFTDIAPLGGGMGGVLWGSAGMTVPWESYLQYGNTSMLREHYSAMVAYIDYLQRMIDPKTGLIVDAQLGDWLGPQDEQLGPDFLVTAYHVFNLEIMARVAEVLGQSEDAAKFRKLHRDRKDFFNKIFVNDAKKTLGFLRPKAAMAGTPVPGREFRVADTQSSYAVGLALGAFNDANIPAMQSNLAAAVERENVDDRGLRRPRYSLMTGFIGTAWISEGLSQGGHTDLAYRLLQNTQYPSWLYPVDQGATTIWERLNGYTVEEGFGGNNGMNSFNHYSFGAVGQWMMAHSLGIQRGEPGFKSFVLQPEPDPTGQMTWASGHYDSPYGRIASSWRVAAGMLDYTATVPPNTRATLYLPTRYPKSVQEGGRPVSASAAIKFKRYENGKAVYELPSGTYRFTGPQ